MHWKPTHFQVQNLVENNTFPKSEKRSVENIHFPPSFLSLFWNVLFSTMFWTWKCVGFQCTYYKKYRVEHMQKTISVSLSCEYHTHFTRVVTFALNGNISFSAPVTKYTIAILVRSYNFFSLLCCTHCQCCTLSINFY